ncbi:MAG: hypothetical protein WBQ86_09790 [Candidatus Binatus sp.]
MRESILDFRDKLFTLAGRIHARVVSMRNFANRLELCALLIVF